MVWALLLPSPHAGTRLPVGSLYPLLPSSDGQDSEGQGWGLCTLEQGGPLVSRVGTASLGPSGKKDPGWCRGTLPGASPHRLYACSFLGYRNCPPFPKGSSGVSQAQQAQCWPPTWLKLYIYVSSLAILTTQPEVPWCLPQTWSASLSSAQCDLGCMNWGDIRGILAPNQTSPKRWAWVPLRRPCSHRLV